MDEKTDFNTIAIFQNLIPEEAENLNCKYMSNDDWDNLCKKKFIERFSPPEPQKHFLPKNNFEKSVAEDLHKSYSANHWKVIRELFQVLGFTGIDDRCILSGDTASESLT
ncbi:13769_t:CDS:2 [Funneliformis geosporum]|uniref:13769_t:CDS:1 n=1 Tax=Funneliformis geosporum TaxID=1117311 RepID=A0A9W4WUM0_9GLOM|nr:13769_t:CDS:2 [Funneliformis geosporum]